MAQKNDGGPAFASGDYTNGGQEGTSLRDWFAGQATEQDIAQFREFNWTKGEGTELVAKYSREQAKFRYADAMIEARDA